MTHLTDLELLAMAERALPAAGGESGTSSELDVSRLDHHLEHCSACREKLAGLRDALRLATAVEIPEPSPLFWDHLSARVRTSLEGLEPGAQDAAAGWGTWLFSAPFKIATAAAVVLLIVIGGVTWRAGAPGPIRERPDTTTAGSTADEPNALPLWDLDEQSDGAWALVRDAADDVSWDDALAAGWIVAPGSADNAALRLTAEERGELVQLLRAETKRSGA